MTDYREDADVRINNAQARGIVLKGDSVLIMFRRKNAEEYYVFPGGHMRIDEKPLQTAQREIEEETTIKTKGLKLAFEFHNFYKPDKPASQYYFVGEWASGTPTLSGEESRRADENNYYKPMWIKVDSLADLTLYPLMAKEWVLEFLPSFVEKIRSSRVIT